MARNGSGTYSLPAGNPVVTGSVISATTHNNTNTDIATALTDSLTADGQKVWAGTQDANGNKIVLDIDGDTSIHASTDDEIDIEIAGADDFKFLANILRALSGSVIETNTINETTAGSGVTIDSVLVKDGGLTPTKWPRAAITSGGTIRTGSVGVDSVATPSTGRFDVTLTNAVTAQTDAICIATVNASGGGFYATADMISTTVCRVDIKQDDGTNTNSDFSLLVFDY